MDKRILIISNEAIAASNSNGRTMKNMLLSLSEYQIAQFYIHGVPDADTCTNYYHVSDTDALFAFLRKDRQPHEKKTGTTLEPKERKRNYRNLVLRNIIWQSMMWWTKEFDAFLNDFRPEVVLLQAGDAPFMYRIARRIAKKYRAKLMMFNTENYVLKKRMYAAKPGDNLFWHGVLKHSLKRQYRKFMKRADYCAYCTEYLEQIYQEKYPHPGKSAVFYTGTDMQDCAKLAAEDPGFSLVYCGNLGVGRAQVLWDMAKVLKAVDAEAKLIIYGKFANEEDQQMVCQLENVDFRGFIAYEQIPEVLAKASVVIHCENPERLENLKTAFSTKIADCLACGKPFLVYATRKYPFVQYLQKNQSAHIAENEQELKEILERCMENKEYANRFVANAKQLAVINHSAEENSKWFAQILCN